jgi:hypothetical protein
MDVEVALRAIGAVANIVDDDRVALDIGCCQA